MKSWNVTTHGESVENFWVVHSCGTVLCVHSDFNVLACTRGAITQNNNNNNHNNNNNNNNNKNIRQYFSVVLLLFCTSSLLTLSLWINPKVWPVINTFPW